MATAIHTTAAELKAGVAREAEIVAIVRDLKGSVRAGNFARITSLELELSIIRSVRRRESERVILRCE